MTDQWLLLRGLTREQLHWGDFINLFADEMNVEVVCIDFPGVGEFYQQTSPTSIDQIAQHVLAQMDLVDLQRCNVLAHSMGGMVSAAMAQIQPHRFNRLVWMNTSFANFSPWYHRLQIKHIYKHIGSFLVLRNKYIREKTTYQLTTNLHQEPSLVDDWVAIAEKHPVSLKTSVNQLWAASQFSLKEKIEKPTLLLGSTHDHFVNNQCTVDIARELDLPCVMHPEAGHDLSVDDPQWVIRQIRQWMA